MSNMYQNIQANTEPEIIYNDSRAYSSGIEKNNVSIRQLKQLIWAYFFLLIFEGALRRWIFPGLSGPLLIIRDPLAIYILFKAWSQKLLPANLYSVILITIGFIGIITATIWGHGNFFVALYGARIFIIHFPVIFVIGKIFNKEDVIKIGNAILWIAIPMAILIGFQFFSPQSAWINKGIGSDTIGSNLQGAAGYFRPPGTFSYTTGTTLFYSLVACFVFYFWMNIKQTKKAVLILATSALMMAIPFSISRSLFFQVIVTMVFVVLAVIRKPKYTGKVIISMIIGIITLIVFSKAIFFQTATGALSTRFAEASAAEGGLKGTLVNRFLGGLIEAITNASPNVPFFGLGIGMGTNVGSTLLTGKRDFLISEGEWGRLIGELGMFLGITVILLRISLCFKLVKASLRKLKYNELLPWLLLSFVFLQLLQGEWAQPTALGFSILSGGLILASLKTVSFNQKFYN